MSEVLLSQILEELRGHHNEVTKLNSEVTDLMGELKGEMTGLKGDMTALQNEMTEIKHEQQLTNKHLTNIEAKQKIIFDQTGKLSEYHNETITRIDRLQTDVEFTYQKTAIHD